MAIAMRRVPLPVVATCTGCGAGLTAEDVARVVSQELREGWAGDQARRVVSWTCWDCAGGRRRREVDDDQADDDEGDER